MLSLLFTVPLSLAASNDVENFKELQDSRGERLAATWTEYDEKQVFIDGLQEDLFQRYVIEDTKAPVWAEDAVSILDETFDLHEFASYWSEDSDRVREILDCGWGLTEENYEEVGYDAVEADFDLSQWSVVNSKSNGSAQLYLVEQNWTLYWKGKTCERPQSTHVFQIVDGKPVYLGIQKEEEP